MKIDLSGRVALVTGGTRGIGESIAQTLQLAGAKVYITGTKANSDFPDYLAVDFNKSESVQAFLTKLKSIPVDIVVNNAGINKIDLGENIQLADFQSIQRVNVEGPLLVSQTVLPGMAERGWGRILNISSIFGVVSKSKRTSYSTSKFAVLGMTKALALDYASKGILINALSPGFIDTELTRTILKPQEIQELVSAVPMGRLGTTKDVAQAALFLVSDLNSFMTGQNIILDGGFTSA